jgi:DNA replication protein DnaC
MCRKILDDLAALRIILKPDVLDQHLCRAEKEHLSHLEFLARLIGEQADCRRERAIERRIREAHFHQVATLDDFDWQFNAKTIDRAQIEQLATCDFLRRKDNLVFVGQSGLGKSRIIQAIGRGACVLGYRVRYVTSSELLTDLVAALADQTLPRRLRYYTNFDLLILDEFGFDRLERQQNPQAAGLLYKVIDARGPDRSTALVTNIDFELWNKYLDDEPLAMGLLDRVVDGAIVLKLTGKSYRAHRAKQMRSTPDPTSPSPAPTK